MHRLTSNKQVKDMRLVELLHNDVFIKKDKDGKNIAWYRDYDREIDSRELIKELFKCNNINPGEEFFTDDEFFDEYMLDALQDGLNTLEGIIAVLYQQLWSKCDLRETLKTYEDLDMTPEQIREKIAEAERIIVDRSWEQYPEEMGR